MKNIVLFIFIFFNYTVVFSQNEKQVDSLLVVLDNNKNYKEKINTLNKICLEYYKNNKSELEIYNQKILVLSKKYNYKIGFGLYFLNCSRIFLANSNGQESLKLSRKAVAIFSKNKDTGNYLIAIKEMARDYMQLNETKKIDSLLKNNLNLALKHKDNEIIIDFYRLLGDNFAYQDSIAKSLIYYKKAIPFLSQKKDASKSRFFQRISDQYLALMQNKRALIYIDFSVESREKNYQFLVEAKKALILNELGRYKEALDLSLNNYQSILKYKMSSEWQYNLILYNIVNAYYKLKKYNLAMPYINMVIDKTNTIPEYKIECFVILSNIKFNLKDKKAARYYSEKALAFHDSLYMPFENFELFSNISKIEEDAGNYKKALDFYRKQVNYNRKRSIQINNEKNLVLQTDFDVTLKDYKIKALQEEKAKKTIENLKQKNYIMLFGGLLILALLSVTFFIKNNKTIKKKNIEIEAEKLLTQKSLTEKEILLKEIHHRVKNNMQLVISLLKIQSLDGKELTIDDFVSVSEARINSMLLIHENLYQNEALDKICFKEYLNNLKESIIISQKSTKNIQLEVFVHEVCFDIQTAIPIGLIINELVNNAYKHAFTNKISGTISISLKENKDKFTLSVSDNGIGFAHKQEQQNGLGLELVRLLVSQIKGNLQIDTSAGTSYTIQFINVIV